MTTMWLFPLVLAALLLTAQCCVPVDSDVLNRMIFHFPNKGCYGRPSGEPMTVVRITTTGVAYSPPFLQSNMSACPGIIESRFAPAALWHRPTVAPAYFRLRAPKQYAQYLSTGWADFPCARVPTYRVTSRRELHLLLRVAVHGIVGVRDYRCGNKLHVTDAVHLEQFLQEQKVANAAVNYLLGVAYANRLCIRT